MSSSPSALAAANGGEEQEQPPLREITAGFLGCGTIAAAIATSLAAHPTHLASQGLRVTSISVTRRSAAKSAALAEEFPDLVTVCDSTTEVVRASELVFLCVLPSAVEETLAGLGEEWDDARHTLVSLVATSNVDDLVQGSGLPRESVFKMICLPPIAQRRGCALLQPAVPSSTVPHPYLLPMLESLGGCVVCPTDKIMNAMIIPSTLMGPMYGLMKNNRDWLVEQGVSSSDASYFVGRTYLSVVQDAERDGRDPKRFDDLIEEQTPGGLNEQNLKSMTERGVYDSYNEVMDAMLSRLGGGEKSGDDE